MIPITTDIWEFFFRSPCATFPPTVVTISRVVMGNLADKQTN